MNRFIFPLFILSLIIAPVLGQKIQNAPSNAVIDNSVPIPHFGRVADFYYRGGQPDDNGLKILAAKGVHTIVDLRGEDKKRGDHERETAEALGMQYISLPLSPIHAPSDEQVEKFLSIVHTASNQPIFVHCRRGSDRTGVMTAIVRIHDFHWTADESYKEMKEFGFRAFLLPTMERYVYKYADANLRAQKSEASDAGKHFE